MTRDKFAILVAGKFNELTKGDVLDILDAMREVTIEALKETESGEAIPVLPKALKVYRKWTPAKKARKGVNPQTGEPIEISAKPAMWKVKSGILKKLREAV